MAAVLKFELFPPWDFTWMKPKQPFAPGCLENMFLNEVNKTDD